MLAESSETVSDRLPVTRTKERMRTSSRSRTLVDGGYSHDLSRDARFDGGGSRSVLRMPLKRSPMPGDRAAQRGLDALRRRGEISLAVERRKNGAAHQGGAAQSGQDRSAEPLHRKPAAIDQTALPPSTESGGSLPRSIASA